MAKSVRDFKSLKECEAVAAENGKDMDLIAVEINYSKAQIGALIENHNKQMIQLLKERISE